MNLKELAEGRLDFPSLCTAGPAGLKVSSNPPSSARRQLAVGKQQEVLVRWVGVFVPHVVSYLSHACINRARERVSDADTVPSEMRST